MNQAQKARLSIVMPAFNEEESIENTLKEVLEEGEKQQIQLEIVVVDDGSTDKTKDIVKSFANGIKSSTVSVKPVCHNCNKGFGRAANTGVKHCSLDFILLIPADGQFDPAEIPAFIDALKKYDLVIGVRSNREGYSFFRHIVSFTYISLVKLLFGKCYRDTNWVQAWRKEVFDKVTPESSGVFFLHETIARAEKAGFTTTEIESAHRHRKEGNAHGGKLKVILFTLYEMLKFKMGRTK